VPPLLLAVPNVSTATDTATLDAIEQAFVAGGARLLTPRHSDADHGRTVFTLAARPPVLAHALAAGAAVAADRIDLRAHAGAHPHVGAIDVVPVVFLSPADRGAACAEALVAADLLAEGPNLPVFLYGLLAGGRTRADLRRGGLPGLRERGTPPDLGRELPLTDRTGATLVAARPPLVAFNLELAAPATGDTAREIAAHVRRLPGVVALGLTIRGTVAQVSTNVEDPGTTPLATVLDTVERHAGVTAAELVGLAPRRALEGWPDRVPIHNRATIEDALGSIADP